MDGECDKEVVERLKCWIRKLKTQGDEWPLSVIQTIYQHNAKADTLLTRLQDYALPRNDMFRANLVPFYCHGLVNHH